MKKIIISIICLIISITCVCILLTGFFVGYKTAEYDKLIISNNKKIPKSEIILKNDINLMIFCNKKLISEYKISYSDSHILEECHYLDSNDNMRIVKSNGTFFNAYYNNKLLHLEHGIINGSIEELKKLNEE